MLKPLAYSSRSTSRPVHGAPARTDAPSRPAGRATSCLQLAAPAGDARRRSRVQDVLAAGQLTIRSQRHDSTHVIAMVGELDVATAQRVEDELRTVEATDVEQVIVDLAGLTFVDSSGVHLIAAAEERCRATAKRLGLRPGPPQIQRVFALTGADMVPFAA
jgi:anti-sigma B factor antagonist